MICRDLKTSTGHVRDVLASVIKNKELKRKLRPQSDDPCEYKTLFYSQDSFPRPSR